MPKTMREADDLAQSLIDSYKAGQADESTLYILREIAQDEGVFLDEAIDEPFFRDAIADDITSHEGVRS